MSEDADKEALLRSLPVNEEFFRNVKCPVCGMGYYNARLDEAGEVGIYSRRCNAKVTVEEVDDKTEFPIRVQVDDRSFWHPGDIWTGGLRQIPGHDAQTTTRHSEGTEKYLTQEWELADSDTEWEAYEKTASVTMGFMEGVQ